MRNGAAKTPHRQKSFWPGGAAIACNALGEMYSLLAYKKNRLASYSYRVFSPVLWIILKCSNCPRTNRPLALQAYSGNENLAAFITGWRPPPVTVAAEPKQRNGTRSRLGNRCRARDNGSTP